MHLLLLALRLLATTCQGVVAEAREFPFVSSVFSSKNAFLSGGKGKGRGEAGHSSVWQSNGHCAMFNTLPDNSNSSSNSSISSIVLPNRLEAIASRLEVIALWLEAIASRLEDIALWLEAIASRKI